MTRRRRFIVSDFGQRFSFSDKVQQRIAQWSLLVLSLVPGEDVRSRAKEITTLPEPSLTESARWLLNKLPPKQSQQTDGVREAGVSSNRSDVRNQSAESREIRKRQLREEMARHAERVRFLNWDEGEAGEAGDRSLFRLAAAYVGLTHGFQAAEIGPGTNQNAALGLIDAGASRVLMVDPAEIKHLLHPSIQNWKPTGKADFFEGSGDASLDAVVYNASLYWL